MMKTWEQKNIVVLGAARQGLALARYLASKKAKVTLSDMRSLDEMQEEVKSLNDTSVEFAFGDHPDSLLDVADLVCVSGGVPLTIPFVEKAIGRGIPLSNDAQVFLDVVPCKVIGITGSAGKTTTTTLVGRIAEVAAREKGKKSPRKVWVGGNIGNPLIANVVDMKKNDIVVMELSSFQLELMTTVPTIATILNITPNHLDRHGTMQAYTHAKGNILYHQGEKDFAVLGREDDGAWLMKSAVAGNLASFGKDCLTENQFGSWIDNEKIFVRDEDGVHEVISVSKISLRGEHNLMNVLAAVAISNVAGFSPKAIKKGIKGFEGVAHRQEFVREWGGAKWFDDSIATAPERTMAAVQLFDEPIVLMLGGRDKKLPWQDLIALIGEKVDHVVLFGEMGPMVVEAIGEVEEGKRPFSVDLVETLEDAVKKTSEVVEAGDVVLLSPGGTSYDVYKDFEERGKHFQALVELL